MSIQDESFPNDEFLDELNFSTNAGIRFQFPHHHRSRPRHRCCPLAEEHKPPSTISTNTSATSSPLSSSAEQNLSTESVNGRPFSGMSSKTTESDPTGLADIESKKSNFNTDQQPNKAVSYQDIHSEYTKRRYKHVESKVGQYIANMKAEDQKRRKTAKFQRHRSMPEPVSNNVRDTIATVRHANAGELHKMNESAVTAASDDIEEELELEEELEPTANSSENTSGVGTATSAASTSGGGRHESSDDCGGSTRPTSEHFVDKQMYAQLVSEKERIQSYSDYLQTRLDEKIGENMRLKRNVDFMRIELSNANDKLKKQSGMNGSVGGAGGSSRQSLQALLCCQAKSSTATQTEFPTPSPLQLPPLLARNFVMHFVTPASLDPNNNNNSSMFEVVNGGGGVAVAASSCKTGKSVATIQPLSLNFSNIVEQDSNGGINSGGVLRQRTNSNPNAKTPKPTIGASSSGCPSSSGDSAIEIESAELPSPRASLRSLLTGADGGGRRNSHRHREQEFIYYDKRSGRYATLDALNAAGAISVDDAARRHDENDASMAAANSTLCADQRKASKKHHNRISLRRRWLRLFGPCTRCPDANQSLDSSALQQTYTQIPLLEKSIENHCRNLR